MTSIRWYSAINHVELSVFALNKESSHLLDNTTMEKYLNDIGSKMYWNTQVQFVIVFDL